MSEGRDRGLSLLKRNNVSAALLRKGYFCCHEESFGIAFIFDNNSEGVALFSFNIHRFAFSVDDDG